MEEILEVPRQLLNRVIENPSETAFEDIGFFHAAKVDTHLRIEVKLFSDTINR